MVTPHSITIILLTTFLMSCTGTVDNRQLPEPGVSRAVAAERSATLTDVRYAIDLNIPEDVQEPVTGLVTLKFQRNVAAGPLVLDFRAPADHVQGVMVDGEPVAYSVPTDHIVIPAGALKTGEQSVSVRFRSTDAALNRRDGFFYSLFVPDRASTAFPLFEQPDIKARYTLQLTIPARWQALSNGEQLSRTPDLDDGGRDRLLFAETLPISSYLFAFAAGEFAVESAERDGRTYRLFHRETDAERVARNREAIFDLHATALGWLEDYTGIDYPFGPFDFFAVPSFQFGGMEHPGAIWYRADSLFLDEGATRARELGRASLIAHETAHMWFGDLVTMRWFNDVWMKEVFANFMAAKIAGPAFPELDLELRFFQAHHPAAYAVDRTVGTNAIRQQLENQREAGSLYGAIIYQKAPVVMRQLERLIGEQTLQEGLRRYLSDYRFGNAGWPELIGILDSLTAEDLSAWNQAWVESPGRPRVSARWTGDGITVTQADDRPQRGLHWPQILVLAVGHDGAVTEHIVTLRGESTHLPLAGMTEPDFILTGAAGVGYGRFELDQDSRRTLLANVHDLATPLHRAVTWQHLYEDLLEERLEALPLFEALLDGVSREQDELIAQQLLGLLQGVWWRYLSPAERRAQADELESVLWQALDRVEGAGRKRAYFNTLVNVTLSEPGIRRLRRLWAQEEELAGLPLQEPQYIDLAEALALRGIPDTESVLEQQQQHIDNPDRQARFRFVRPAFSADPAVRESLFDTFSDPANRRQESWVLAAMRAIHHPLRADDSVSLIRPALEQLESIRDTGDIFFPLSWLHATLDGHNSQEAAAIVQRFITEHQDMEPKLRGKLLQAADGLFRAARGT
ncbi:MAG: M1 family aminopeptidase [Gammaproteobacteria bacterium]